MTVELLRDIVPAIGLKRGAQLQLYQDAPPRTDGQVWVEGERRYRKKRDGALVELPRFVLLEPEDYKEIQ